MRTTFIRISILLAFCTFPGSGKDCGPSEYESAAGECCPMCSSGYIVRSDCNGDSSTTCKPCAPETFMNEPNGIYNCFQCRKCAEDLGLYTKSKCTTIQDTFCDVLDGYYCLALSNSQCSHAVKHSVCKAGQETKTQGTKTSDTVCVDCAHGFYSPSGLTCIKWTDCTALNEIQTENGTSVKDVTCITKTRGRHGLIYGLPVAVLVTLLFFIFSHQFSPSNRELPIRKKDFPCPIQETNPASTTQSTNILEERNRDQK